MSNTWTTHQLATNQLELEFLPGIGGRLWDVRYAGSSLLFQNTDLRGKSPDLSALSRLPTQSPQFKFPLWGGEKTWIAPDTDWISEAPFAALDSGPYEVSFQDRRSIHMQSSICPDSHLRVARQFTLLSPNNWKVRHSVQNHGQSTRQTGIWPVLMLNRDATIGLKSDHHAKVHPVFGNSSGRVETTGDYTVIQCDRAQEFKVGTKNRTGQVFIRLQNATAPLWLICRSPEPLPQDRFAHGHNFEVFNSGDYPYCEAEWHAPLRALQPGESISYDQEFSIGTESGLFSDGTITLQEVELISCMS